jgi:hypothetical protein
MKKIYPKGLILSRIIFSLGWIAVLVGGCATTIPLPNDIKIEAPGPEVSPEMAVYSGIWQGVAESSLASQSRTNIQVIVEQIHPSNIKLIYSWQGSPVLRDGWARLDGKFENGQISASLSTGQKIQLRTKNNGKNLDLTWEGLPQIGVVFGTLSR